MKLHLTRARVVGTALVAAVASASVVVPRALSATDGGYDKALACSQAAAVDRDCVMAIASTYLGGEDGSVAPADVLLDPQVARHALGAKPEHKAGNAEALRAGWAAGTGIAEISDREWTVDGAIAFVAYRVHKTHGGPVAYHVAARITVRAGVVWEVLVNPTAGSTATQPRTNRTPFHPVTAVAGPVADPVDMTKPDYDNAAYCSLVIADLGTAALTQDQHRRCLIAIAATYVDAEGNSIADSLTLFDPRFSKYSLGDVPNHHPGNGDTNRTDQTALSPTIRLIDNKQWTSDTATDQVWIVYDGYLPVSTDKPGFYVAERLTIRDGLIWEIMISPVITDIPNSFVPGGPPKT